MNDFETWIWLVVGLAVGFFHSTMLWHAVHRLSVWSSLWGMFRLLAVAAVLLAAALGGNLLAAAAGWAAGLVSSGTWFVISGFPRSEAPSPVDSRE
jgi:hypothetical protein